MGIENEFVTLMGKITGTNDMRLNDKMEKHKEILESNCVKIQREVSGELSVDIEKGNEPCPFCFSRRGAKAKMVWIGINPGKALDGHKEFKWTESKWQDIVDYCIPKSIYGEDSIYDRLVKGNNLNGYYRLILRLFMQLQNEWPCDNEKCLWSDYKTHYKIKGEKTNIKELFFCYFDKNPVLTADLIPYKSKSLNMNVDGLLEDDHYKSYFRHLIKIINDYSEEDAWVIFFKKPDDVKKLLDKFTPQYSPSLNNLKKYKSKEGKDKEIYVYKVKKRRVVIMPFGQNYDAKTDKLVKAIKEKLSEYNNEDGE